MIVHMYRSDSSLGKHDCTQDVSFKAIKMLVTNMTVAVTPVHPQVSVIQL